MKGVQANEDEVDPDNIEEIVRPCLRVLGPRPHSLV